MGHDGNILTTLVLVAWIPFALWTMRRYSAPKAAAILLFGSIMFLPEEVAYKFPGIPEFGKQEIAMTWIVVASLVFQRDRVLGMLRLPRTARWLLGLVVIGIIVTVLTNRDVLVFGPTLVEAHGPYDIVHQLSTAFFLFIAPFVISATMFRSSTDLRVFMQLLVSAAMIYGVFQLIELRFSPQFHRWIYGYHQHQFVQAMRKGGFRPMVFMSHGLAVAMFTTSALFAAAALYRLKAKVFRLGAGWVTAILWGILAVSKSIAAFLYSLAVVPVVLFLSPKAQVRIAFMLSILFFAYPVVRSLGVIPVDPLKDIVTERYGTERAESLMTRFENEDQLLVRARERLTFGWGSFCRACVWDDWNGDLLSVRDGDWIIMLGDWGLAGFVGKFGLLFAPIWLLRRRLKYVPRKSDRRLLAALSLIVAVSVLDLLPNGNFNYLHVVFSGALLGCLLGILQEAVLLRRQQRAKRIAAAQRGAHAG